MKSISLIKIGGALVTESGAPEDFWDAVETLASRKNVVVVHGGGPHATRVSRMIGHQPVFVHGRRVTGDLDLEIVQWTMRGALNVRLVAQAVGRGLMAVGLCGADSAMVRVHRRPPKEIDGRMVDFGWVGDVDTVDTGLLEILITSGRLPIVAPMGVDDNGLLYNVNADTMAMQIAVAISANELVMVTDSGGVRRDPEDAKTIRRTVNTVDYCKGVDEGWITGGMRAKLENALEACQIGVPVVRIVGASQLGDPEAGTRVTT